MIQKTLLQLFGVILAVAIQAAPCDAKPTREQIVAFAEISKASEKRMDLVAEFGRDFAGLDLSGIDFRGYYRVGYETSLINADFSNCNLRGAKFGSAILDGANFTGANLEQATFITASLRHATLLNVNLKGTRFYQSNLSGAKLAGAGLSSADVTGSDFGGADLSDAVLAGAKNEYWWSNFAGANLSRANLSNLPLNGGHFENANLTSADLSGAQLVQADFTGADLTGASLKGTNVESAVFRNARGLSESQKDQLEQRANRGRFEFQQGVSHFLNAVYFPAYALAILLLFGLSFSVIRRQPKSRSVVIAIVVNVLAIVPAGFLLGMSQMSASPTAQFNAGNPGAMGWWSTWVYLWPLFMLALLACLLIAVVTAFVLYARNWRWAAATRVKVALIYHFLTVVHCLFALHWVGSNFPDA